MFQTLSLIFCIGAAASVDWVRTVVFIFVMHQNSSSQYTCIIYVIRTVHPSIHVSYTSPEQFIPVHTYYIRHQNSSSQYTRIIYVTGTVHPSIHVLYTSPEQFIPVYTYYIRHQNSSSQYTRIIYVIRTVHPSIHVLYTSPEQFIRVYTSFIYVFLTVFITCSITWYKLPNEIKAAITMNAFSKIIKTNIINNY